MKPHKTSLRINSYLWPVITGVLLILQVILPFKGWTVLLIGVGGSLVIAYFWCASLRKHLHLTRLMRYGWAQVGDILEEKFILTNQGFYPGLWVEIHDGSSIPGYEVSRVTGIGAFSENAWVTHQTCSRRGLFTLGPTEIHTGDPFGIFSLIIFDDQSTSLLVTPPVFQLPNIQVAPGGRSGEGRLTRHPVERTVNATGVRDYLPGDSLRWIHWPTSAKRGDLYVKMFENTPASDWWIVLDLDRSVQLGVGEKSSEEIGVILAASMVDKGLREGAAVGMTVNSRDPVWIPPRRGESQRLAIFQDLARVSPGERSLEDFLEASLNGFRHRTSLVLITPSVQDTWLQSILMLLRKGVVPTILLLDPSGFNGKQSTSGLGLARVLTDVELVHYRITPDMLEKPVPLGKERNAWEWLVSATGKAIPVQHPKDFTWKTLS